MWAAFLAVRRGPADRRPPAGPPHGPRHQHQGSGDRERHLDHASACPSPVVIWGAWGGQAAGEYISGYLIEKSLSVDNVFVWAIIMSYFAVPREYQFRVLFWGVFGALVLRFVFIFAGVGLLNRFEWMLFVFGGFLIFTAIRLLRHDDEEIHPENNPVLKARAHGRAVHERVPRPGDVHQGGRQAAGHAAVRRAHRHRDERRDLRGRLDPRHPRGEPRARSSSSARTPSRSSACERSTSCSPTCATSSTTCRRAWRSSSPSSASR